MRTFPAVAGPLRFAVAPRLRERLRLASREFDVIDVHTRQASLALAVASARVRRLVLTPCASAEAFLGWPHTRATRAMLAAAPRIVCRSEIERDLLCASVPQVASRTAVVPDGIDPDAIRSAEPFDVPGTVVLAVDRLDRSTGVGRAIAAMASLDPEFRLVIVGDGPARDRLQAFADDLRVSSRIQFAGPVSDAVLHRWLRTARVVVSLPGERELRDGGDRGVRGGRVSGGLRPPHPTAGRRAGGRWRDLRRAEKLAAGRGGCDRGGLSALGHPQSGPARLPRQRPGTPTIDATWDLYEAMLDAPHPSAAG